MVDSAHVLNAPEREIVVHILVIPSYFPNEVMHISGIFFLEQVNALHTAGHQVGVIVPPWLKVTRARLKKHGLSALRRITHEEEFTKFPVYRMHWGVFPRAVPLIAAPLALSATKAAFQHYVTQHGKPDIIHGHDIFYGGYLSAMLGTEHHIPSVLTEHSTRYMEGKVILPGQQQILRRTIRQLRSVICVSHALLESLRSYDPTIDGTVIPNLINTDYFSLGILHPDAPFTFFAIGSSEPRKRFDMLIDAFHQAFKSESNVRLKLAGEGSETPQIKAQVSSLGLDNQIDLLGRLNREHVRAEMQQSHVIISGSQHETFGMSLIEALACGKPIVSTASGGPNDIVTPDVGLLVPVDDLQAFSNALRQIRDHYSNYDAQKIREACVARYSESAVVTQIEQVYDHVLQIT
mgnify:CR=1 FL=1